MQSVSLCVQLKHEHVKNGVNATDLVSICSYIQRIYAYRYNEQLRTERKCKVRVYEKKNFFFNFVSSRSCSCELISAKILPSWVPIQSRLVRSLYRPTRLYSLPQNVKNDARINKSCIKLCAIEARSCTYTYGRRF